MSIQFTGQRLDDSGDLIGDTLVLRHMETGTAAFAVDSATVSVSCEGVVQTPDVEPSPGTSSIIQILEAIVSESNVGRTVVAWRMGANGQTILRQEVYFVTWTNVREQVRGYLMTDPLLVLNGDIDMAIAQCVALLVGPDMYGDVLHTYQSVPEADRFAFDAGLSLMAAAWMRPFVPKTQATTDVVKWVSGLDQYQWAQPVRSGQQKSVEEAWLDRSWELFSATGIIGNSIRAFQAAGHAFTANGRRRGKPSALLIDQFGGVYANPASPLFYNWMGTGAEFAWSWIGSTR